MTQRVAVHHVSNLCPFLYDEGTLLTPLQVADIDTLDEFVIYHVVEMRSNTHGVRSALEFKVRWAGYDSSEDTWEPWKFCSNTDAVQMFLKNHNNKRIRRLAKKDFVLPAERESELSDEFNEDKETSPTLSRL